MTRWSITTRTSARCSDLLDELGIAEDTFVMYSTDNGPHRELVARRRDDAVPQREEHQLGGRVPHSIAGALAGQDQGRHQSRTRSSSITTGSRPSWPWPASPTSVEKAKKGYQAIGRTYKNHIDGYNLLPYLTGKEKKARARASSTSATTATCSRSATTTGKSCSWSSAATARCRFGQSRSRDCGYRRSSTCAPIRTSSRTSRRTPTTTGSCSTHTDGLWRADARRPVRCHVQRLSADPEAEHLHDRRRGQGDA